MSCVGCSRRNPTQFALCLQCRKRDRRKKSASRQGRIAGGVCERCGANHEERTARCGPCKDQARDVMRGIRESRYDAGLCMRCGKESRPVGEAACDRCRVSERDRRRRSRVVPALVPA